MLIQLTYMWSIWFHVRVHGIRFVPLSSFHECKLRIGLLAAIKSTKCVRNYNPVYQYDQKQGLEKGIWILTL